MNFLSYLSGNSTEVFCQGKKGKGTKYWIKHRIDLKHQYPPDHLLSSLASSLDSAKKSKLVSG